MNSVSPISIENTPEGAIEPLFYLTNRRRAEILGAVPSPLYSYDCSPAHQPAPRANSRQESHG
jgi:hypothetical protein